MESAGDGKEKEVGPSDRLLVLEQEPDLIIAGASEVILCLFIGDGPS